MEFSIKSLLSGENSIICSPSTSKRTSTMAKLAIFAFIAVLVAVASAASFGGAKDLAGNYYDFSTGQYSSALTGKVYDTAPVAPVAYAPHVAPVVAGVPSYHYGAYPYGAYSYGAYPYGSAYVAPVWK